MYRLINITIKICTCVNVSDIYWHIIKHLCILTANIIVYHNVPETVLCVPDAAVSNTENVPAFMMFISQSDNEPAI